MVATASTADRGRMLLRISLQMSAEVGPLHPAQLPEQRACSFISDLRRHHLDLDDLIATPSSLQRRSALSSQTELLAALRARGNSYRGRAIQSGDLHPRAQGRFGKTDGNRAQNLVARPREEGVVLHL